MVHLRVRNRGSTFQREQGAFSSPSGCSQPNSPNGQQPERGGHWPTPIHRQKVPDSTTPVKTPEPWGCPRWCADSSTRWRRGEWRLLRSTLAERPATKSWPGSKRTSSRGAKLLEGRSPMGSSQTTLFVPCSCSRETRGCMLAGQEGRPTPSTLLSGRQIWIHLPNHGIWLHRPRGSCECLNSAGHHS